VLGSADTVVRALAAGAEPPLLVTAADTVYTPGDVGRFVRAFEASGAAGGLAIRRDPPPDPPRRPGVKVAGGLVVEPVYREADTPFSSAPLWAVGPELVPLFEGLSGPPYELVEVVRRALASKLEFAGIEIGKTRDLTYPHDLIAENVAYLPPSPKRR
jgi:hypothetical protein